MVHFSLASQDFIGIALPFLPCSPFLEVEDISQIFSGFFDYMPLIDEFARKQGIDYLAFLKDVL